jgi:uncharacterized protein
MITVAVKRQPTGDVQSITIDGHARYDDPGKDIVCAAVSGISLGLLNAVDMLLGIDLSVQQGDNGYLHWEIPMLEREKYRHLQLLMDGMIASLRSVAIEYGKFVKVHDIEANRRWM